MSRRLWMAYQCLHAAERDRIARDAQVAKKLERRLLAAFEIEREHAAREIALLVRDADLLRIDKERRIVNARPLGIPRQLRGDALGVLAGPVHTQVHGRQASVQHPAFVRLEDVAEQTPFAAHLAD